MVLRKASAGALLVLFGVAVGASSCTSSSATRAQRPVDAPSEAASRSGKPADGSAARDAKQPATVAAEARSRRAEPALGDEDDPNERARIWWNQRAYPANQIPSEVHRAALHEEMRAARTALDGAANNWTNLGPGANRNITYAGSSNQDASGRTLAIAISPADQNLVLIGAAQGGIWKSTDRAATFRSVGDGLPSLAINVLRFAPSNPNVIYAGSGEPNGSTSIYGAGVFKSTDAGETWQALPASGAGWSFDYLSVSGLQVDPRNANNLFVTTADTHSLFRTPPTTRQTGIFKSTDGGQSWSLLKAATTYTYPGMQPGDRGFMDLKSGGPSQPDLLYITEYYGGIYRSLNAGQSWTRVTPLNTGGFGAFPASVPSYGHPLYGGPYTRFTSSGYPDFLRIDIAVPASNPRVIYAAYATDGILVDVDGDGTYDPKKDANIPGGLLFKSTDGGDSWSWLGSWLRDGVPEYCADQCDYDTMITVNPADENDVVIGGSANYNALWPDPIDNPTRKLSLPWRGMIYRTLDGGRTWVDTTPHCTHVSSTPVQIDNGGTMVTAFPCDQFDPTRAIHPDIHTAAYAPNGQIYIGSDGGINRATVTGAGTQSFDYRWENLNATLSTLQFYLFDSHPSDPNIIVGGLQDNSVAYFNGSFWDGWGYGDGTLGLFEPGPPIGDPNHVYIGTQHNVHRHDGGGAKLFIDTSGNTASGWHRPIFSSGSVAEGESVSFTPVFAIDAKQPQYVYGASEKALYISGNRGDTWAAVKPFAATNGRPTVIESSFANNDYVWLGTSTGYVYLYQYTGSAFTGAEADTGLPDRYVTKIVASTTDANTAWVAFSGYNANTPSTPGKVFKTTNKGQSWTNISGNLPDVPVSALAVDPGNANRLWAGTDIGVFSTTDGGATWTSNRFNMPIVAITDIKYNKTTGFLMAATHGRGLWRLALGGGGGGGGPTVCTEDATTMCLVAGRYKVTSHWRNQYAGGATATLSKAKLTDVTGAFWIANASTYEYLIRFNTATDNHRVWIAIPTFTDVEYWIDVTDTRTGQSKEYHSLPGNQTLIYDPTTFVFP